MNHFCLDFIFLSWILALTKQKEVQRDKKRKITLRERKRERVVCVCRLCTILTQIGVTSEAKGNEQSHG